MRIYDNFNINARVSRKKGNKCTGRKPSTVNRSSTIDCEFA